MSNEDKAKEITKDYAPTIENIDAKIILYDAVMDMAQWKDEMYKEREEVLRETINAAYVRLQKADEAGMYFLNKCNIQKQQLIEKACEWWENELTYPSMTKEEVNWCQTKIVEFKKAMEE